VILALLLAAHAADLPHRVHIDRTGRALYLLDPSGAILHSEPIGIGRGGLGEKRSMGDLITPTGTFTVDLIVHAAGTHDALSAANHARYVDVPDYAALTEDLSGLYANMSALDFDGDGQPDRAYGGGYIGLHSASAVTGPKMRRYRGTPYWYSIALHGTPDPATLGEAASGGCVHLSAPLLERLITEELLTIGSTVEISDGPPGG